MSEVEITVRPNGPYRVKGPVTLIDPTGATVRIEREYVSLCRCGHSKRKPFCDSSHRQIGFEAAEPCPQD